jgi:hypothetical protein
MRGVCVCVCVCGERERERGERRERSEREIRVSISDTRSARVSSGRIRLIPLPTFTERLLSTLE